MKYLYPLSLILLFTTTISSQDIHTLYSLPSDKMTEGLEINNLRSINSSKLDYCPVPIGKGIIFTSNRTENLPWYKRIFSRTYSNLLFTINTGNNQYTRPFSLPGKVNGKFNEGAATISADGNQMFFTRNAVKKNKDGLYDLNIYSAHLVDKKWQNVEELDLGAGDFTNCHPAISADGQTLYFASNRPGGYGGMDIYVTQLVEGEWGAPTNLGSAVNSEKTELFPQIGQEGELYFSTDATGGLGQLDIWVSRIGASGTRMAKQNMGAPINSAGDDFSFVMLPDNRSGYLTSNRKNGMGGDDIYSWEVTLPKEMEIETTPAQEQLFTNANINITNNNNEVLKTAQLTLVKISYDLVDVPSLNQPFFISNNLDQSLIDMIGERVVPLNNESAKPLYPINPERQYFLVADHSDYKTTQQVVSGASLIQDGAYALQLMPINEDYMLLASNTPKVNPVNGPTQAELNLVNPADLPIASTASEENTPVVLVAAVPPTTDDEFTSKGGVILETDKAEVVEKAYTPLFSKIYHAFDKYVLNANTKEELSDVVSTLRKEINTTVLIESHTDSRGSNNYNNSLSQKRADEVRNYLINQGIAGSRITAVGYGSTRPLVECLEDKECPEETHDKNRRTEIILTRKD